LSETVTFDGAPPPGTINLGIGQPSADLLPVSLVHAASELFFETAQPLELNYGVLRGDQRFLNALADFLSAQYGETATAEQLFVTGGNSQALDLVSCVFARPGDTVFVEEPSYFLAFNIFRDHGLKVVGIPIDDDGLCVDALRDALQTHRPAFLYTIPSFHNPGGQSTTAERRQQVVELAEEYDFLVVADEVYQMLYYYDAPPPAYGTLTNSKRVLSLGSFSKILAPAMRLGWIQTSDNLLQKILANGFINSGGCINHISAHIVRQAIDSGILIAHIEMLRLKYRDRLEAMHAALLDHFADIARWTKPAGGYFFWLTFDEAVDTAALREQAPARETGFQNGAVFSTQDKQGNCLRVCFAHYNESDIREGIARMRTLF
jgi:DNA-binding transcriptional MocR family regulator